MIEAFLLGLIGSLHCIGMCGPIALSLPSNKQGNRLIPSFQYNLGRIFAYAILGVVFGVFGKGLNISGFQQWVSIGAGVLLIISVIFNFLSSVKSTLLKPLHFFYSVVKSKLSYLFKSKSKYRLLGIGFLNGFLPCGLVYIALVGALLMPTVYESIVYMLLFGLGTSPALVLLIVSSKIISNKVKQKLSKIIPIFIALLGLLFILRGIGLGIPYISPEIKNLKPESTIESCH